MSTDSLVDLSKKVLQQCLGKVYCLSFFSRPLFQAVQLRTATFHLLSKVVAVSGSCLPMSHHELYCTCPIANAESCAPDKGAVNCSSFPVTNYGLGNGNDDGFKLFVYWPLYVLLKTIATGRRKQCALSNRDMTHREVWKATQGNGKLTKIIHVSWKWIIVMDTIKEETSDSKDSLSYYGGPGTIGFEQDEDGEKQVQSIFRRCQGKHFSNG